MGDGRAHVLADGSLDLGDGLVVAANDVKVRVTTPGGPGGQHANRTESRVVVSIDLERATSLPDPVRERLVRTFGRTVSASSMSSRSQQRNRRTALENLAQRLAGALVVARSRTATKPTRAANERRLAAKRRRSLVKDRRTTFDD
jgi:ribosome-associated protein